MRARLPIFVAIAFGAVGAAGGCLLTSDFDGVVGTKPPAADEGGSGTDAAADAGNGGDGGQTEAAVSPCATGTHVVCTDFDEGTGGFPVPGWNNSANDGGVLTLDNTTSVTPPLSLHARVDGASSPEAYIYRQVFLPTFTALTVAVDMRIVACPPQGKSLTAIYVEPSAKASFGLVFLSSGVQAIGAGVNGAYTFFQLEQQVPDQTWSHIVYRILLKDASTSHLTLTVDGKKSVDTDAPGGALKTSVLLNLGLLGGAAPAGCEVQFDNYVLDKE
jgi:hypothetical protein